MPMSIISLSEVGISSARLIGFNAALLGEVSKQGFPVVQGYVIPSNLVFEFMCASDSSWENTNKYGHFFENLLANQQKKTFRNNPHTVLAFHKLVQSAIQELHTTRFMVSPSVVVKHPEAYSSLSVFANYEIPAESLLKSILEQAQHFWHMKLLLDNGVVHEYSNEQVDLSMIIQKHEKAPAIISYTYERAKGAVYFEYGNSIDKLRGGTVNSQKIILGTEDEELFLILVPFDYKAILKTIKASHNKISELFNAPIEISWRLQTIPEILSIRIVKEEVKMFSA